VPLYCPQNVPNWVLLHSCFFEDLAVFPRPVDSYTLDPCGRVCGGLANLVRTGPVARNQSLSLSIGLAVRGKSYHSRPNMH